MPPVPAPVPPAVAGPRRQEIQADDACRHYHDENAHENVPGCRVFTGTLDPKSLSDSMFRPPFLGPESVKRPVGLHWKLVGDIESELLAVVPQPHDRSAGAPELGEVGPDRSRTAPDGDTDIETEPTAVVRPGRIEKLPDGHPETCGQTEKLVDRYVPTASLCCADRRSPPAVAEMGHACGEVSLSHAPKDAIRPDVCGQSVGRATFPSGRRADPRRVRSADHRGRITLRRWRVDGHWPSDSSAPTPAESVMVSVKQIPIVRTLYGNLTSREYSPALAAEAFRWTDSGRPRVRPGVAKVSAAMRSRTPPPVVEKA